MFFEERDKSLSTPVRKYGDVFLPGEARKGRHRLAHGVSRGRSAALPGEARKGRHRLAHGDSRGRSAAHRAEPRQGRHNARKDNLGRP